MTAPTLARRCGLEYGDFLREKVFYADRYYRDNMGYCDYDSAVLGYNQKVMPFIALTMVATASC